MWIPLLVGLVATLGSAALALAQGDASCPARPTTLQAMHDCYRPVLVFAGSAQNAKFAEQQALLEQHADDLKDRDMLYVPVLKQEAEFSRPQHAPFSMLNEAEKEAVRQKFRIGPREFAVLLIGKDGGEKHRSGKPVPIAEFDRLIDAMPMRKAEAKSHPR